MNEKLTIQDLVELLVNKHEVSRENADIFVREFFLLIEQALYTDQYVKIKGLGTFKLIEVNGRESVDVNTGERIKIEEHTKISFTPDSSLKDIVNRPFSHFEAVVLNENTVLEDTPIEELEEDSEDMSEIADSQPITEIEEKEEAITEEKSSDSEDLPIEEIQADEKAENHEESIESAEEIIAHEDSKTEEPDNPVTEEQHPEKEIEPEGKKSPVLYLIVIIAVVMLLCGGALFFVYYPDLFPNNESEQSMTTDIVEKAEPIRTVSSDTIVKTDTVAKIDTIAKESPIIETVTKTSQQQEQEVKPKPVIALGKEDKTTRHKSVPLKKKTEKVSVPVKPDSMSYTITGTKESYTIKEGETLTKISLRFYGTKDLWPYIVKHNQGVIKNPNNVPYGTVLRIPILVKK